MHRLRSLAQCCGSRQDAARRGRFSETSFDPGFAFDTTSAVVIDSIMESMLDYDYLARPVKLVPRTLEAMPAEEDGGKTYVCKLRKGIFFTPDPASRASRAN